MTRSKTFVIGICGGSCSGKTTLARRLHHEFAAESEIIFQDSYYIDQSRKFKEDGGDVNFDHPDALDFALMAEQLKRARAGEKIEVPIYDFATHTRKAEVQVVPSKPLLIVDGTLLLSQPAVLAQLDLSVFLEANEELRFARRKHRDSVERGRTLEGITKQFLNHVKPMHDLFVEVSKKQASWIVPHTDSKDEVFLKLCEKIRAL